MAKTWVNGKHQIMPPIKIAIINLMIGYRRSGAESNCLWIIEALKDMYELYLITTGSVDFKYLNECWGTNIKPSEITVVKFPQYFLKYTNRFFALRYSILGRFCKRISSEFNVMFSTYNVMDFGKRGIQSIGDFLFSDKIRRVLYNLPKKREKGWFYRDSLLRKVYLKLCKYIFNPSEKMIKNNLTLVNSEWTRRLIKKIYAIDAQVVYPPVTERFPHISWDKRETGFVCIGRLVPFKKIERTIEILTKLRERSFDIHLHIIGKVEDSYYANKIKQLCDKNSNWCFLEGEIDGQKKLKFIAKHKFGINGCQNEAFGIAVAEMMKAGCIVWVPNGGGQVEIVNNPLLIYENIGDATDKIGQVLKSNVLQVELRQHLATQSKKFSSRRFIAEIKKAVHQFLKENID